MQIVIFVYAYPYGHRNDYVFVKQLVEQFALMGNHCYVISPYPIFRNKGVARSKMVEMTSKSGSITVYRPNYLTFPFVKIGRFVPSIWLRNKATKKCLSKLKIKPDVVYCHFWNQGLVGYKYAKNWNVPLFVASGESNIAALTDMSKITPDFTNYVSGVVCVSSKCKNESLKLGLTTPERCEVIPNAIDNKKFFKKDKNTCREELHLPKEAFVVCFVGWFIERKGPVRVSEAIEKLNRKDVLSIFIGSGSQQVNANHVFFKGAVNHDELSLYLNAADIFVLPTLNEGCCNAIIEAMACGLPIISSNLSFNWDLLNESNSIMIDPENIDDISNAIKLLYDDKPLREKLSKGALATAGQLTIEERAKRIIDFIKLQAPRIK